ncbi:MAG: hypothetical protein ACE369_19590, partial [Roseovarius sp.]
MKIDSYDSMREGARTQSALGIIPRAIVSGKDAPGVEWEDDMKYGLYASVAALALSASGALAGGHMPFAEGEGAFNWDSYKAFADAAPDLSGQTLTVSGPWLSPEADRFDILLNYFEAVTGVDASYTGSDSFEQQIVIDAEAGSPPNIAVFPQPGLAAVLAGQGQLAPLGDE